jgi:hypothetical protein
LTQQQDHVHAAVERMSALTATTLQKDSTKSKKGSWRENLKLFRFNPNFRFTPGVVNLSPGWFAQAHEVGLQHHRNSDLAMSDRQQRLEDKIVTSKHMQHSEGHSFIKRIRGFNVLTNAILALTHPKLHQAGVKAISMLKNPSTSGKIEMDIHPKVKYWNSAFSGLSVINNRETTRHRDAKGTEEWYDLLFSCGDHSDAYLGVPELGAKLSYDPGTVVLIAGYVFSHKVDEWEGERICLAYYLRNRVHERLRVLGPSWIYHSTYLNHMNGKFVDRQGWAY